MGVGSNTCLIVAPGQMVGPAFMTALTVSPPCSCPPINPTSLSKNKKKFLNKQTKENKKEVLKKWRNMSKGTETNLMGLPMAKSRTTWTLKLIIIVMGYNPLNKIRTREALGGSFTLSTHYSCRHMVSSQPSYYLIQKQHSTQLIPPSSSKHLKHFLTSRHNTLLAFLLLHCFLLLRLLYAFFLFSSNSQH